MGDRLSSDEGMSQMAQTLPEGIGQMAEGGRAALRSRRWSLNRSG